MRMTLDEDEKRIVRAVIHGDAKRQRRTGTRKETAFDRKATAAIKAALEEMDLGEAQEDIRQTIMDKIYKSLVYNTPWEYLGETYCCRSLFYAYRKQFCFLVAVHLGIAEKPKDKGKKNGKGIR